MKYYHNIILMGVMAIFLISCEGKYEYREVTRIDAPAEVRLNIEGVDDVVSLMAPKTKSLTITLNADSIADEYLSCELSADFSKVAEYNKSHGTSYEAVPAEAFELSTSELILPRYNTISSTSQLLLKSANMPEDGSIHILPISINKIECGDDLIMDSGDSTVYVLFQRKQLPASGFEFGSGTESDPYLIQNQIEMLSMSKALKSGQKTWFKMANDIDMTDYEDWVPAIDEENSGKQVDFDGDNHKIVGFNCSADVYPSMFGCFVGDFHDVVFDKPVISAKLTSAGLIAAKVGSSEVASSIRNVTVNDLRISSSGIPGSGDGLGGLVGNAENVSFAGIDIEVSVIDADDNQKVPSYVGGLVGFCSNAECRFSNCKIKGNVIGNASTGGLIGASESAKIMVENCSANVNVTSYSHYAGGVAGYCDAGFEISASFSSGDVTGGGNYVGGLLGAVVGNASVKRCGESGNVESSNGNHVGGLIGNVGLKVGGSTVEDCFATGNVSVTGSHRMAGGLIGVVENVTDVTVRRCFASGNVTSEQRQVGGLISIAKSKTLTEVINFTMEKCIAWNKSVISHPTAANNWSSGGIIGVSNIYNTLSDNYRRSDMDFLDYGEWVLFDQENVSSSSPLGGYNASLNKYPYHGKAASAGATLSSVASLLNWPDDVWDMTAEIPKLK